MDYPQLLAFAKSCAYDAGPVMRDFFERQDKGVEQKLDKTSVTEADKLINAALITAVNATFPDHGVLGEEASVRTDANELWVCDPIDGTDAFIAGIPTAMYSLAFVVDGAPVVVALYDPFMDKLYTAVKGQGAFCNDMPIHVSSSTQLEGASLASAGSMQAILAKQELIQGLLNAGAQFKLVQGNVYKGCLVATGKLDGYLFPGRGAHDVAGLQLLIEEAGGIVTSLDGTTQRYDQAIRGAIVSNGAIHQPLVDALRNFDPERYIGY